MLADFALVILLLVFLAVRSPGALATTLASARGYLGAIRRSPYGRALFLMAVLGVLGWAQLAYVSGPGPALRLVWEGIPPGVAEDCYGVQGNIRRNGTPVPSQTARCPRGGGAFEKDGRDFSCAVHGRAP